jgi:hypothetical protein
MVKGDISFYVDTLLVETVLGEPALLKTAQSGALSGLGEMVKSYFQEHVDQNDKVGSVINMLAPAAISMLFRSLGFGKLGLLFGLVASTLHINIGGMIESIYNSVKSKLENGKGVAPAELDSAVNQAIQEHTSDEASPDQGQAFDKRNFDQELREARLIRLALEQYDAQIFQLRKDAAPSRSWLGGTSRKATGSLIGRIIGWVFKLILFSGGFLVAGDLANKLLGRPNAFDHTYQAGQTPTETSGGEGAVPGSSSAVWVEPITNNRGSIENMLIGFAKDLYPNLAGKENAIRNSPTFQTIRDQIAWYNQSSAGEPEVYIPPTYPDKKSIVDRFVGEVSKNAS